jgi:hypothetical protein
MEVHFPIDFESRQNFRRLEGVLGPDAALAVFTRLWIELAQLASARIKVGFMPQNAVGPFCATLPWLEAGRIVHALAPSVEADLPELCLLRQEEGGFFCPDFARDNKHCSPDHIPMHMLGVSKKNLNLDKRRAAKEAQTEALFVDTKLFVDERGQPLDAALINKIQMLVKLLDGYLQITRRPQDLTPGLIQDARQVWKHYEPEQVDRVCQWIYLHREHPSLPRTTEQVLRDFERLSGVLQVG